MKIAILVLIILSSCKVAPVKKLNVYIDNNACKCVAIIPDKNTLQKKISKIHIDSSCFYRINIEQAKKFQDYELVIYYNQKALKNNTEYSLGDAQVNFKGENLTYKQVCIMPKSLEQSISLSDTLLKLNIRQ